MHTMKPFAAFGYILIKNTYSANEIKEVEVNESSSATFFWTRGKFHSVLKSTGEEFQYSPGDFITPDKYVRGIFTQTHTEETIVWCYDPKLNRNFNPILRKFSLAEGSAATLFRGTKLFLCEGIAVVNERSIDTPTQLLIKTADTQIKASTQLYGIIFE